MGSVNNVDAQGEPTAGFKCPAKWGGTDDANRSGGEED